MGENATQIEHKMDQIFWRNFAIMYSYKMSLVDIAKVRKLTRSSS